MVGRMYLSEWSEDVIHRVHFGHVRRSSISILEGSSKKDLSVSGFIMIEGCMVLAVR